MKRKKFFLAIAVFILIICVLAGFAGCTSGSSDNAAEQRDNAGEVKNSGENVIITTSDRLMVYYVDISVVVEDVAVAEAGITAKLKTFDGYTQTIRKSDSYTCLTLRVPTDKLEEFVAEIKGKGDVEDYTVTGVDITDEYMNAQNRKSALEAEKARLEALLAEAETLADKMTINSRLYEIATRIDEYDNEISGYKKQSDYSTVTVYLYEENKQEDERSFWDKLGDVLAGSAGSIGYVFGALLTVLIAVLPYLGLAAVVFGLYVLIKFIVCKIRKKPFGLFVHARLRAAKRREEKKLAMEELEEKKNKTPEDK